MKRWSGKLRNEDLLFLICSFSNRTGEHALKLACILWEEKGKRKNKFQTLPHSILVQSHLIYSKALDTHTSLPHSKFHTSKWLLDNFTFLWLFLEYSLCQECFSLSCIYKSLTLPSWSTPNITFSLKPSWILLFQTKSLFWTFFSSILSVYSPQRVTLHPPPASYEVMDHREGIQS